MALWVLTYDTSVRTGTPVDADELSAEFDASGAGGCSG